MVTADMAMSLDGFVADAYDGMLTCRPDDVGAHEPVGAVISGRRSFDITGGWGGRHPLCAPVFVVTHSVPYGWPREHVAIFFVTNGIEAALERARAVAGDADIAVTSPSLVRQFLDAELLDRIWVSVVPILLGDGVRFFDRLAGTPIDLDYTGVVEGTGATHLSYRVCRRSRPRG